MTYLNEHLLPGIIGKLSILLAIIFAAAAALFFLLYAKNRNNKQLYRFAHNIYTAHFVLIGLAVIALFYIILNHYFEYNYVWRHSSLDTPLEYIISCFWAGQEGSFLFWIFVQGLTGFILLKSLKSSSPHALFVFSLFQFLLLLNILGIHLGSFQIGNSPFVLLRELSDDPLFNRADYLLFLTDGNGLNPLLLNPWMVSHPPLIFIGYALTAAPFALFFAAMIEEKVNENINRLLLWTVLAVLFLGAGIIVGGAWAYEALTFGGFWAWDPIENASLVPWLVLLGALHLLFIVKRKRQHVLPAFILLALAFWFVLYASFLTRSGILSETSVHSFSNDGTSWSLVLLLMAVPLIASPLLIKKFRRFKTKDDNINLSKEFLLYMGAIFLLLSAFQIIFSTSLPVFNKLFGSSMALPLNSESFYNTWQLPFAFIFCILIALSQFLNYGSNDLIPLLKKMILPFILSLLISIVMAYNSVIGSPSYILLLFASLVCIFFTLDLYLRFRKSILNFEALITHLGFGIFIFGTLLTFSNKYELTTASQERSVSIVLPKNQMVEIAGNALMYTGDTLISNRLFFDIAWYNINTEDVPRISPAHIMKPHIILNSNMGNVYEPYVKKYPRKDIFMYITFADIDQILSGDPYHLKETLSLKKDDTVHFTNTYLILEDFETEGDASGDIIHKFSITALVRIHNPFGDDYIFKPTYRIINNRVFLLDDTNDELGIKMSFSNIGQEANTIELEIFELHQDYIVVKISVFPFINILWIGVLIMFAGLIISVLKYIRKKHK